MVQSRRDPPPPPPSYMRRSGEFPQPNYIEEMNNSYPRNPFLSKPAIVAYVAIASLLVLLLINPWKRVITDAGTQTVVIDTPMIFGEGGVRPKALEPGSQWIWRTTKTVVVDPKPQVVNVGIDDFVSRDNILLDFESSVTLQVYDWPLMYSKFGVDWWKNNLARPYMSSVRGEVKVNTMSGLMSDTTVSKTVDDNLTAALTAKVKELGIPARVVEINLGRAKPNATILEQMNATATQQQRLLTLEQSRLAEEKRAEEQKAKAMADNAYRNQIGLNVEEFVQLELADKMIQACKGAQQCVILPPGTNPVVGR